MSVTQRSFGVTKKGEKATLFRIENNKGMAAEVTDFGAILTSLFVPDKDGNVEDIVLGFDSVEGYFENPSFFGSTIGRNANRIGGAKFTLNGVTYNLAKNDGENNLHSDIHGGFNKRMFKAEVLDDCSVKFSLSSPDMDEGFPGNLEASVIYRLTDNNGLELEYSAKSDADTVYNPTNHSYFNLAGHAAGAEAAMAQKLWLNAKNYTPVVPGAIPTGEIATVAGTPFDFTTAMTIGDRINNDFDQLKVCGGYDHNFALDISGDVVEQIAIVSDEKSGRRMSVYTDLPGVQFYAGNFIATQKGKGDVTYGKRYAICLETQFFPNSVNDPNFKSPVLRAGEEFKSITKYVFNW